MGYLTGREQKKLHACLTAADKTVRKLADAKLSGEPRASVDARPLRLATLTPCEPPPPITS
jgi:hypothetical protein